MPNQVNGPANPVPIVQATPEGWVQEALPGGGARLSPAGAGHGVLQPTFTAEVRREPTRVTLAEVRIAHVAEVSTGLSHVRVLDAGQCAVGDWDAHRVLLSHLADGVDVTLEQWTIPLGRHRATLTVQAPTLTYAALHADFHDLVESVDLGV